MRRSGTGTTIFPEDQDIFRRRSSVPKFLTYMASFLLVLTGLGLCLMMSLHLTWLEVSLRKGFQCDKFVVGEQYEGEMKGGGGGEEGERRRGRRGGRRRG